MIVYMIFNGDTNRAWTNPRDGYVYWNSSSIRIYMSYPSVSTALARLPTKYRRDPYNPRIVCMSLEKQPQRADNEERKVDTSLVYVCVQFCDKDGKPANNYEIIAKVKETTAIKEAEKLIDDIGSALIRDACLMRLDPLLDLDLIGIKTRALLKATKDAKTAKLEQSKPPKPKRAVNPRTKAAAATKAATYKRQKRGVKRAGKRSAEDLEATRLRMQRYWARRREEAEQVQYE